MGAIRIRFIKTRGFVPEAICLRTGSLVDHVEFGTRNGTWIGAHLSGGIQERPADYCKPIRELYYELPCSDQEEMEFESKLRTYIGTKYGCAYIIGILLNSRRIKSPDKFICSGFFTMMMLWKYGASRYLNVLLGYENYVTPEEAHLTPLLVGHRKIRIG